jgi:hypothetical protein
MDEENLNLNEGQEDAVDSQTEQVDSTVETVNADNADATTGKQEETKPVQSPEENAKFAEVRRKTEAEAKAKARDELIAEMYGKSHGIHTYAEYQEALAKQEEEQKLSEMLKKYIPEEYAKEMIENRKFREQFESEQKAKQQQEQKQADMIDFIKEFPNVKPDDIPVEVWQANERGIPLRYVYAEHAYKQAMKAEEIAKANAENAKSSTGSISGDGVANDGYFTKEQVSKMTSAEIARNYEKICESTGKW